MAAAKYFVEARTAVRDRGKAISYGVWCDTPDIDEKSGRRQRKIKSFSVSRNGGWQVALYLANTLCDNLNKSEQVGA